MSDFFPPTYEEIVAELSRELQLRRRLFPEWVSKGKIKQDEADRRINRLQAAYDLIIKCNYDHGGGK